MTDGYGHGLYWMEYHGLYGGGGVGVTGLELPDVSMGGVQQNE